MLVRHTWGRTMCKLKLVVLIACAVLISAPQARAITYIYTGPDFTSIVNQDPPAGTYTTSMSVSGNFTLAAPLGDNFSGFVTPTSFSFFDGRNTITDASSFVSSNFDLTTDGSGNIVQWHVFVSIFPTPLAVGTQIDEINSTSLAFGGSFTPGDQATIIQCTTVFTGGCSGSNDIANTISTFFAVGSWSSNTAATPLPAALPLFATGLGGLGLLGWRRKRKAQATA